MMTLALYVISAVWLLRIIIAAVSYSQLWRIKEYRFDRMLIHLKTPQGKRVFIPHFRRPSMTPKSVFMMGFLIGSGIAIYVSTGYVGVWALCIYDILLFPLTFVLVGILNIPVRLYHTVIIWIAVRRLHRHAPMTVIGITGSYGKTSVKEYAATILSASYTVLKTEASKNSAIGIAETVIRSLMPEHQVFVAEMGAYKPGEIAHMCMMVQPEIAVVTAINEQHQDLFGSIESTIAAKYELIKGLTGKRIMVANADDPRIVRMGMRAKTEGIHVWWIGTGTAFPSGERLFRASSVQNQKKGISCTISDGKERFSITVPLAGIHQVTNVLLAVASSVAAGMPFSKAVSAVGNIRAVAHTLEYSSYKGILYIDDTFNNNPDAARAALSVLQKHSGRKILVFQPMIELGAFADIKHEEVGAFAASVCDEIILTNSNWQEAFQKGAESVSSDIPVHVMHPKAAFLHLRDSTKQGDTVLFKGKEAAWVLQLCKRACV